MAATGVMRIAAVAFALVIASTVLGALAQTSAPETTLSADGRTATDGIRSLTVSQVSGLPEAGLSVVVDGSGYNEEKGIYVAYCVIPERNEPPTPCGGGIDLDGNQSVSHWISSNPPPYGEGLAVPYGPGGTFSVTINVVAQLNDETDCRVVACAVVTRNDHTRSSDRSQDIFVPVSFGEATPVPTATEPPAAQPAQTLSPAPTQLPITGGSLATPGATPAPQAALQTPEATPTPQARTPTPAPAVAAIDDDERDEPSVAQGTDDDDGGSPGALPWLGGIAVLVLMVAGGAFFFRRWRGTGLMLLTLALVCVMVSACSISSSGAGPSSTPTASVDDEAIVIVDEKAEPDLPVTVESADGRTVTVDDVSRILPLWGNISEIVFGLGLGDNVVGRDVSATFDEASDLPMVTRAHDVSAESVLSLRPSVVLASDQTGPAEALDHIRDVGIPVVVFEEPVGVDDIVPRIHAVAQALGVEAAGDRLAASVEAELEAVRDEVPSGNETSVAFLYMRGQAGVYLIAGPGSGADSMIEAAGALDAGTQMGLDRPFTPLTSEALVKAAPDVILMTTTGLESVGGLDGLLEIPGIKQTPAGRDARIVTIEDGLLYSFGPRTPRTIAELSREIFGGS